METETRTTTGNVQAERLAYEEGEVLDRSFAWVERVHHVLEVPDTVRGEQLFEQLIREAVANGGRVLEAGCASGITARQVVALGAEEVLAVDLSHRFLDQAVEGGDGNGKIEFRIQDLHEPVDGRFRLVVGRSILHHIDWRAFLKRTYSQNLEPGGRMVFMEPMRHPMTVAFHRIVRSAHTPGEYPLGRRDVRWLEANFAECAVHPINFFSFPAGVLSSYLFKDPDNFVTRAAEVIDKFLERFRMLHPYARQGIFVIEKPGR
jgi:SAM-dependent methyltransferase